MFITILTFMTLAHQEDDIGVPPVKTVIGKMHYNWGYGVGSHDWKITHPQVMTFFGPKKILTGINISCYEWYWFQNYSFHMTNSGHEHI